MKNKIYKSFLCIGLMIVSIHVTAQVRINVKQVEGLDNSVFMYRDTVQNMDGRGSMNAPMFMIYPDKQLNEEEANALINDLELGDLVVKYAGSVGVINPVDKTYNNQNDLEAYKSFINRMRSISNLKILGIGNGATFVNDVISRNASEVAGIFVYGGKITKKTPSDIPVPAYISGGDKAVANHYIRANEASEKGKSSKHIVYANDLFTNYPQIDPSRVYVQGLSAGAMTSAALGIRKSHVFAAVGGHSGAIFDRPVFGFSYETLSNEAKQKAGFVETPYFLITGTADDVIAFPTKENYKDNSFLNAIRLYQQMNNIPEANIDFDSDPILGIKLQDRETILTNKHLTLETGKLYRGNIPLIQFTAIMDYGHWNYRPAAQMMWDFFKQFSRDPETKKLIYHKN